MSQNDITNSRKSGVKAELTNQEVIDDLKLLWSQKVKIIGCVISFGIISVVIAFITPSVYQATVLVQPVQDKGSASINPLTKYGGLASFVGSGIGGADAKTTRAIATLHSRKLIKNFIEEKKLLPILFSDKWNKEEKDWDVNNGIDIPTLLDGYELFVDEIMNVSRNEENGLITISIEWTDRSLAKTWAEQVLARTNNFLRLEDQKNAMLHLKYLQAKFAATPVSELRASLAEMIKVETQIVMLADSNIEYAFETIDPAVVPENPIKPKKKLIIVLGLISGLILGLFWASLNVYFSKPRMQESNK